MKIFYKISMYFILYAISLSAQTNQQSLFEIGGSVLYSYSNTVTLYKNVSGLYRTHQFQFEPEFGYYLNSNLELLLDLNYTMEFFRNNVPISGYDGYLTDSIAISKSRSHRIGLFLGVAYNYCLNDNLIVFGGSKVGISSSRFLSSLEFPNYSVSQDSHWSSMEFSFPSFFVGTKIFLDSRWKLLFKVQYIKTYNYEGVNNKENDSIAFGIGFLISL